MADERLSGWRIAVLVADGFEQVEMTDPVDELLDAGAEVEIVSPASGKVRAWNMAKWGMRFTVERPLEEARAGDYDALLLPGGEENVRTLRHSAPAIELIRALGEAGRPTIVVGAAWEAEPVIEKSNASFGRGVDDIATFRRALVDRLAQAGRRERPQRSRQRRRPPREERFAV